LEKRKGGREEGRKGGRGKREEERAKAKRNY
jgi:hypothetical protein